MPIAPIPLAAMLCCYTRGNFLLISILPTAAITYNSNAHCDNTPWPQCSATTRMANFLPACTNITYCSSYLQHQCPLCQYLWPQCSATTRVANFCLYQYYLQQQCPLRQHPWPQCSATTCEGQFFAYTNITDRSNINFSGNSHALAAAMSLTAVILLTVPTRRINTVSYTNGTYYYSINITYSHNYNKYNTVIAAILCKA